MVKSAVLKFFKIENGSDRPFLQGIAVSFKEQLKQKDFNGVTRHYTAIRFVVRGKLEIK